MKKKLTKVLSDSQNGNCRVIVLSNGTKIRQVPDTEPANEEYPETIDLCISHRCSFNCKFCYNNSHSEGDYFKPTEKFWKGEFFNSIPAGTELAIGGGALSQYPDIAELSKILINFRWKGFIPNITLNARELTPSFQTRLKVFVSTGCVYGIGISYHPDSKETLLELKRKFPDWNIVIHTILGVTTEEDYDFLAKNKFKVLVLGYKQIGRGKSYSEENFLEITKNRRAFIDKMDYYRKNFKSLSFDCLGAEQVKLDKYLTPKEYQMYYMGDDGNHSMFIDLVDMTFSVSSTTSEGERIPFYNCSDLKIMFEKIKKKVKGE